MWRSRLWASPFSSSSAVLVCPSWQGPGEVLEGPGRLPSLREPNWNSVYLAADTPLCRFLSVSLNPFLCISDSLGSLRIKTHKSSCFFLLLVLIYIHTPYLKHTVTYRRCLSDIFFPLSLSLLPFRTCTLSQPLLFRGSCAVVSSSSPPTQPHFSLNLSFSSPYPFVIFIVWEEEKEEEEEEELFSVRCLWKQWSTEPADSSDARRLYAGRGVKLPLLLLNTSSTV